LTFSGDDGKPQLGHRKLIKGEKSFFLKPGEDLENGIQVSNLKKSSSLTLRTNKLERLPMT
jgi:major vault protein